MEVGLLVQLAHVSQESLHPLGTQRLHCLHLASSYTIQLQRQSIVIAAKEGKDHSKRRGTFTARIAFLPALRK